MWLMTFSAARSAKGPAELLACEEGSAPAAAGRWSPIPVSTQPKLALHGERENTGPLARVLCIADWRLK